MKPALPVVWQNELVGHIENPKPDNLRLYGRWRAIDSDCARRFADMVTDGADDVWITLGTGDAPLRGRVTLLGYDEKFSDVWIELAMV